MRSTYTHLKNIRPLLLLVAATSILVSCGTYNNGAYQDTDGIYATGNSSYETTETEEGVADNEKASYYKQYFESKDKDFENLPEEGAIFTDIEAYHTTETIDEDGYIEIEDRQYDEGYGPWGTNSEAVTVNVYNNGGFGWNNWGYGLGWNRWGYGLGFNNWGYGFGWNNYWGGYGFGYPFYGGFYGWGHPFYGGFYGGGFYGYNNFYGYGLASNYAYNRGRRNLDYNRGRNYTGRSNAQSTRGRSSYSRNESVRRSNVGRNIRNSANVRANRARINRTNARTNRSNTIRRNNSAVRRGNTNIRRSSPNRSTRSNTIRRSSSRRSSGSMRSSGGSSRSSGSRGGSSRRGGGRG